MGAVVLVPAVAQAATLQPAPVAQRSVAYTPQVVASQAVPGPHVDAIAVGSSTTYAGGRFDTVSQGGGTHSVSNLVAFDTSNGAVRSGFRATVNGQVWDLELDPATNSLYVAGDFTSVNGANRSGLAKLDATTGETKSFTPYFSTGKINDISLVEVAGTKRLFIGGGQSKKLASLDPVTGKNDGYLSVPITNAIPGAWGGVAVYQLAVNPTGTKLIATGNFLTVGGEARSRFFVLDLGPTGASLDPWYYKPFSKPCGSDHPRRIAYLQGVDWSPTDPNTFNVAATGQIPEFKSEVWHEWNTDEVKSQTTVCDAIGRFSLADPTKPVWINYTGGDSVWRVQDTGSAVYASGHFQWLDNPDGFASKPAECTEFNAAGTQCLAGIGDKTTRSMASRRLGIGAINPDTGKALAWNPGAPGFKQGGKALVASNLPTGRGLWIGNDSKRYGGQARYGLAFAPLP